MSKYIENNLGMCIWLACLVGAIVGTFFGPWGV